MQGTKQGQRDTMTWESTGQTEGCRGFILGSSAAVITKILEEDRAMKDIATEPELHEVQVQSWNYIVEPPDSPATIREGLSIPTGLSPLIQKINLK